MTLTRSHIEDAAQVLAARRISGDQGPRLPPDCRPETLDEAFDIQAAVTRLLGARIGGWKCALPSDGRLVAAPIFAGTVHADSSACPVFARGDRVRAEPELAFVLGCDLPARSTLYTPAEVDAAIARTHIALELIDSRYLPDEATEATFAEKLADGLVNQGLFLGPEVDAGQARLATDFPIDVRLSTGDAANLMGHHPDGPPRAPLYWLVEFLRSRGHGLFAGQAVITGSYAGSFPLPLETDLSVRYGNLGELSVRFTRLNIDPL